MVVAPVGVGVARRPLDLRADDGEILGVSAREERERVVAADDRVAGGRLVRHAAREGGEAGVEDARRLRAVEGRGRGVGAERLERDLDARLLARAPAEERELPVGGLGIADRLSEFGARVGCERAAADAEDDIADREDAVGRRTLVDLRHEDLARLARLHAVRVDPAARAGRAEVPVVGHPLGNRVALREVGDRGVLPRWRGGRGRGERDDRGGERGVDRSMVRPDESFEMADQRAPSFPAPRGVADFIRPTTDSANASPIGPMIRADPR